MSLRRLEVRGRLGRDVRDSRTREREVWTSAKSTSSGAAREEGLTEIFARSSRRQRWDSRTTSRRVRKLWSRRRDGKSTHFGVHAESARWNSRLRVERDS
ncbi:hypothetical protein EXIGLDRAFT_476869 [Exidia glandulosa HHB12029]|uniref:Uncharacterized protein n=1 Tax=Exidia glandulosa HHB12029 TaxID=1314781 RepID=A0A165JVI0_EXIGL|nr:hypothetical protein EXIGLDRAFT_476869 [Exidia glandulosa HHB12029]